jgi:Uma2 family endonuclease
VHRMALSQITWQDVQQLPDDGNRYEAIEGELYVTPAPSIRHQRIAKRLMLALHRLLEEPGHGELFFAPTGVEFPATEEGVQPDLLFVSNERKGILAEPWIQGAPDLVIEILSPTTARRDRGVKRKLYERQGVSEYWIVDPEAEAVEVWAFSGTPGEPRAAASHRRLTDRLPVRLAGEVVGEIDLPEVFRAD